MNKMNKKKCMRLSERYCFGEDNCITCYEFEKRNILILVECVCTKTYVGLCCREDE